MSLAKTADHLQERHRITAADARKLRGFLAVPLSAIREHGQAAQTLGGLISVLRLDGKRTFRRQDDLAKAASVSARTLRRHLAELEAAGAVVIEPGDTTSTYRLTADEADLMADGFLPIPRYGLSLPWAQRLILGWVVYRAELSLDGSTCTDGVGRMSAVLGLDRRTIQRAIGGLVAAGLMLREGTTDGHNGRLELLAPTAAEGTKEGGGKVAYPPNQRGGKVADPLAAKWPTGGGKVADHSYKKISLEHGSKKKHVDQKRYSADELAPTAAEVFRRCGYRGSDGRNLWKLAAMLTAGAISEHELWDACQGARECAPRNRPAYVVAIAKGHLERRGADLRRELAKVRIEPLWPSEAPKMDAKRLSELL